MPLKNAEANDLKNDEINNEEEYEENEEEAGEDDDTEEILNSYPKNLDLLPYSVQKNITQEDPLFPLSNLEINNSSNGGWKTPSNCSYPQEIIVNFNELVDIKSVYILLDEIKIPTKITDFSDRFMS